MHEALSLLKLEQFDPAYRRGAEQRFCCPLPACADKSRSMAHRSLSVNAQSGAWHCHRCGASGMLAEYRDREPRQACGRWATASTARPQPVPDPRDDDWRRFLTGLLPLTASDGERYLCGRGIAPALPLAAGVRYHPRWVGGGAAVVFPLRNEHGVLVGAQGRYLDPLAAPRMKTVGRVKLGVFLTPQALTQATVLITEAPIDALSLAICGYPALATCGAKNLPTWLPAACIGKRVLLAHDPDDGGEEGAELFRQALRAVGVMPERLKPSRGDWNDYLQQYGAAHLTDAMRAFDNR